MPWLKLHLPASIFFFSKLMKVFRIIDTVLFYETVPREAVFLSMYTYLTTYPYTVIVLAMF